MSINVYNMVKANINWRMFMRDDKKGNARPFKKDNEKQGKSNNYSKSSRSSDNRSGAGRYSDNKPGESRYSDNKPGLLSLYLPAPDLLSLLLLDLL